MTRIIELLEASGEYVSTLTSFHVHVGMGCLPPVEAFKSLVEIAMKIEAPMFRLSVAESHTHRGLHHNDYMYCRPLMGIGPQYVVDNDSRWRQCFDLPKILVYSNSTLEACQAWGRADQGEPKWVPPRYYWLNPVPLFRQGTIEFRLFNQTMDVDNMIAWVNLCVAIVKTAYAYQVNHDYPAFPLGETSNEFGFKNLFELIDEKYFTDNAKQTLFKLWAKSEWQRGVLGPQVNHLAKNGRTCALQSVREKLLAPIVTRDYIESIWNNGYNESFSER
jgi:hypothetical protein